MTSSPSLDQLEAVAEEFARVRARFAALEARVSDEEWIARPAPNEWSVSECVAHLNLSMVGPVPIVLGIKLGKTTTAAPFVPSSDRPRSQIASEFRHWNSEEAALVREAEDLQVDRTLVESPFAEGVRYDAFSALRIVARHEHRHLKQAERALARVRGVV